MSPYSVPEPELLPHRTQRTWVFQSRGEINMTAHIAYMSYWGLPRLFCMSIRFSLYYYDKYFLAILNLNRCAIMRRHVHVTQRGRGQIAVCLILQKYHPLLKMRDPRVCGFVLTLKHSFKHIQIEWSLFIKHQKRFQFKSWWNLLIFWMDFCEWVTHTFIIYTLHEWGSDVQKFGVVGLLYF